MMVMKVLGYLILVILIIVFVVIIALATVAVMVITEDNLDRTEDDSETAGNSGRK